MERLYTADNTKPAYQLNWGLTVFWRDLPPSAECWLADLKQVAESDGVRILKHRFTTERAGQFFISTKPHVAPSAVIRSVKGRLQHLVRQQRPKAFQRNYCLRSVGAAKRSVVEDYVAGQLGHHPMVDPRAQARLARYQRVFSEVDLSKPSFSSHGKYWYNVHLVIVNDARWMEIRSEVLDAVSSMIERVAVHHGYRLSRVGIVADHLHATLACPIETSPQDVALRYLNNCAYACGMKPIFHFGYYVGTIGEYDRGAVK